MFQTDQATAAALLPAPAAAGTQGYFTNGNPSTGVAATILDADFMNMVMLELANVVTGAGLTLSKTTYNQVLSAIKRIGQNTIVLADTGAVNAYTAVNATPLVAGTWIDGVVQAVKIAHTNTGASTYAPDGLTVIPIYGLGLQPLQGGELLLNATAIFMRMTIAGVNSGNPIAVLMECAGGAQQIPPATASQHAVQLGQLSGTLRFGVAVALTTVGAGNWTVPAGVTLIEVELWGAGGATSGSATSAAINGAGAGAYVKKLLAVTPGASISYNVGGGGSPVTYGGTGGSGGTTTFNGGALSALGGGGSSYTSIGGGGNASGGDLNINGSSGAPFTANGGTTVSGGIGGSAPRGGGGGSSGLSTASGGVFPGGGAGGPGSGAAVAGQSGANGLILIRY